MGYTKEWYTKTINQHDADRDAILDAEYNEYIDWAEYAEYLKLTNEDK